MKHIAEIANGEVVRLTEYLPGVFPVLTTNSGIKKAIKRGQLLVNGASSTTGYHVQSGDVLSYITPKPVLVELPPIKISVVYEDEFIAVVNKPAGLTSSGNMRKTLANYLPHILQLSGEVDALPVPLLAHRLDKATSGLVIVGKTSAAIIELGAMLSAQKIDKKYAAIVEGTVSESIQQIDDPIDGQAASTVLVSRQVLTTKDPTSLLYLSLETGRTHQIRKHLHSIGHPIVGDPIYNNEGLTFRRGLFLAAVEVRLTHPITNKPVACQIDLPSKFRKYLPVTKDFATLATESPQNLPDRPQK